MAGTKVPDVLGKDPSAIHSSSEQQEVQGDQETDEGLPSAACPSSLPYLTHHLLSSSPSFFGSHSSFQVSALSSPHSLLQAGPHQLDERL